MKEFFRKRMVTLKRRTHLIPLVILAVAFVYYSLNLTVISNTTSLINGTHMGLAEFATMLFSVLSLVCFLNAFPHRKKVNVPMLVLMVLMAALLIFCDTYYMGRITYAVSRTDNPIDPTGRNAFITDALNMLKTHRVILIVSLALTALLPVYKPLLKRINTSVNVEDSGNMETIDISGE